MVGKQKLNSAKDRSLCGLNIQRFFHPDFKRTLMDFVMLLIQKCINLFAISSKNVLNTSQRIPKNSVVQQFKLVNVFEFVFS